MADVTPHTSLYNTGSNTIQFFFIWGAKVFVLWVFSGIKASHCLGKRTFLTPDMANKTHSAASRQ